MNMAEDNDPSHSLSMALLATLLKVVTSSGANATEALSALRAAEAMLPSMRLSAQPSMVIKTAARE